MKSFFSTIFLLFIAVLIIWQTPSLLALIKQMQVTGPPADQEWTNSLGMKLVPAGTSGVLIGVWDVRVMDYAAFVKATGRPWSKPDFTQTDTDPAVNVSWRDAKAFCDWLTTKEQTEEKLAGNQGYRLLTDAEWSRAAGLNEDIKGLPEDKDGKIEGLYPWGIQWPPPKGAGNYDGEDFDGQKGIKGYQDGYEHTSPVGSFAPNRYGLYDMGGNVWQWCEDWYSNTHEARVARGASWGPDAPEYLLVTARNKSDPDYRSTSYGFRVVLMVTP